MESEYALAIPNVRRAKRATARRDVCVVVDNGSHELRAGFAGDADPCLRFPNQLIRPRSRWSTEFETVVGECQFNVKGFDFGRAAVRSAFDGNVVVNFDTQEAILDYVFDRMGFQGGRFGVMIFYGLGDRVHVSESDCDDRMCFESGA